VVQKYITCEGRFSTTYRYHMRFLLHLNGNSKINLPLFLLKSLTKMANKVQTHPKNAQYSLFHQGVIKVLVMQELNKNQTTWEHFLSSSGFETREQKTTPSKNTRVPKEDSSLTKSFEIAKVKVPSATR